MMTKKDFQEAARQVRVIATNDYAGAKFLAESYADLFMRINPKFDKGKFLFASGIDLPTVQAALDARRAGGNS